MSILFFCTNLRFKTYIATVFALLFAQFVHGQEIIENLKSQYENTSNTDSEKLYLAGKYITALFFNHQEDLAQTVFNESLSLALQQSDKQFAANLYAIDALNKRITEQDDESALSLKKAKHLASSSTSFEIKGYLKYCEGWLHARDNKEGEAVKSFLDALIYYDQAPPSPTLNIRKSSSYKELTTIYANWNELELQEKYSTLALEAAIAQGDPIAIFDSNMLKGYMYEQHYIKTPDQEALRDEAEKYYLAAIDTYHRYQHEILFPSNLSFVANNLAYLYFSFYPESYRDKALFYAELAKTQGFASKQYTHVASAYGIMSEIALADQDTAAAKNYLLSALIEMSRGGINDQNIILSIYESLSDIAENEKNLEEALRYQKLYMETFKSIHNQDQIELGRRLEAQFDKERQKQQIIQIQLESDKKEQQISLMNSISLQQKQEFENLKLHEENQRRKLELSQLESEKQTQELQLSRLETANRAQDILNYKNEINYKEKINTYYVSLILAFILALLLLLYAYKQRSKTLKQHKKLYLLNLEQERQHTKISTLTAMLDGQESERGRLARDLHDGLGGLLSNTKIHLSQLHDQITPAFKTDLNKSLKQIDDSVDELRRVAHNLMPDLLERYGLQVALNDYADRMSMEKLSVSAQFLHYRSNLNKDQQLIVYRIIQELVNNAIKHADASQILIQLVEEMNLYHLTVEDNGKGFDRSLVKGNTSSGLHNIQSRIAFLKGDFQVFSDLGIGTSIEINFPKITLHD